MKSISGKITSTKSISLSKASKVLSNFVNAETGASQAVSSYLRRASASFGELVRLHKELEASKPDRKPRKVEEESTFNEETVKHEQENEVSQRKKRKSEEIVDSAGQSSLKKKKKRRRNEGED